ncbi:hypothetical protein CAP35_00495 [Chitinophagaceae bacterium IBVUCB1]|nr:hypothetical protein CAP35_00495 [Chitinophagaceae bacterium IBVUCB1]
MIFVSCDKVDVPMSKQEKMRASDWTIDTLTITYMSYTGADSEVQSLWKRTESGVEVSNKPDCLRDDFIKFRDKNDGSHIPGPNKCATSETNDIEFTWGLRDADTKVYMYGLYALFGQDVNADMLYFEDDNFAFSFPRKVPTNGGDSITVKITCKLEKK